MITLLWTLFAVAAPVVAPSFDRVDHGNPKAALDLPRTFGSRKRIEALSRDIGGHGFDGTLDAIGTWMNAHLVYDETAAYHWRDVDTVLDEGTYGGCADQAMVFGALARASGIPVVWVKTMDVDWIRAFRAGPEPQVWSGHVFLEVWDGQRWELLDVARQRLYSPYDTDTRLLPGNRYAYDKGLDPFDLVLSTLWPVWKEQTRAYFGSFDLALIDGVSSLPKVVIAGDNPQYDLAADRLDAIGFEVGRGGNFKFEEWMPNAVGNTLVVLSLAGKDVLTEPYRSLYVGGTFADLAAERVGQTGWIEEHVASDGTRVVLVYGANPDALAGGVQALQLRQPE